MTKERLISGASPVALPHRRDGRQRRHAEQPHAADAQAVAQFRCDHLAEPAVPVIQDQPAPAMLGQQVALQGRGLLHRLQRRRDILWLQQPREGPLALLGRAPSRSSPARSRLMPPMLWAKLSTSMRVMPKWMSPSPRRGFRLQVS
jgi:hypothetical protein